MRSTLAAVTFAMVVLALTFGLSNWATHNVQAATPAVVVQTAGNSLNMIGGNSGPLPGTGRKSSLAIGGNSGPLPGTGRHMIAEIGGNSGPLPGTGRHKNAAFGGNSGPQPGTGLF